MSYDLRLWEHPSGRPLPKTVEDAGQLMLELEVLTPGVNPKFVEFAEKLVARYPARDMYAQDDPDANDAVWIGNPLKDAREWKGAVFGISLPQIDRPRVTRFLVDSAHAAGLTVYDDQSGIAFLPNGKVLPKEAQEGWKELKRELDSMPVAWSKSRARKALATTLSATLAKHGFRLIPRKERTKLLATCDAPFIRGMEAGYQQIHVWLNGSGDGLGCALHAVTTHHAVEQVWNAIFGPDWWKGGGTSASLFFTLQGMLDGYEEHAPLGDEDDVESLGTLIEAKVLPVLDQCRTVRDTVKLLDGRGTSHRRLLCGINSRLILARLAGDPRYEAMAEDFSLATQAADPEYREKLRQLIEHLKGVQPL